MQRVLKLTLQAFVIGVLLPACAIKPGSKVALLDAEGRPANIIREVAPTLSQAYAEMRAKQVSNVRYRLSVRLTEVKKEFEGKVGVEFTYSGNGLPVTLDFNGGTVVSVTSGGKPIPWEYNNFFIVVSPQYLVAGGNQLDIQYTRPYATNGDGLHKYRDSETDNIYVYTNFEPFNANKLFPHFDQPNIKATYLLDVIAPQNWSVISATREVKVETVADTKHWYFPQSAVMASYVFSLHAGPFTVWEQEYKDAYGSIPLRLFARQELAEFVVPEDWFTYTTQSFTFFNQYFDYPYPYKKYDQIIVPDFNAGAMENIAAVTFTEWYVKRGERTEAEKARVANVVAHELAHMWFGNLVTMDWWNGLWLNESFATFMAYLALDKASDFENAWNIFYARTKQWAYTTDQRSSTHSIELPVPTTADAFTNFDGITYGKGASVLKQLPYFIGADDFRRGISAYLRSHANGNAKLEDFTGALAQASDKNLDEWSQQWLHTAGLNTIQVKFSCNKDVLAELSLIQTAPKSHPTLREQRVNVGLFSVAGGAAKLIASLATTYRGKTTKVIVPDGTQCPDLIYPNYQDWAYVKVLLDEASARTVKKHIEAFSDTGLRLMLWQSMWDGVLDGSVNLLGFIDFVAEKIHSETDIKIAQQLASQLYKSSNYLWANDTKGKQYTAIRQKIADALWVEMGAAKATADRKKTMFDQWVKVTQEGNDFEKIRQLLSESLVIEGLVIDQDRRWSMVKQLNRFAYSDYAELTASEFSRDSSDRGKTNRWAAEARQPTKEAKQYWIEQMLDVNTTYKLAELVGVMRAIFPASQSTLKLDVSDTLLDALPELIRSRDLRFLKRFSQYMMPEACKQKTLTKMLNTYTEVKGLNPVVDRYLNEAIEEEQRCLMIGATMLGES